MVLALLGACVNPVEGPDASWPKRLPLAEEALAVWPEELTTDECRESLPRTGIYLTSRREVVRICGGNERARGCYRHNIIMAILDEKEIRPWIIAADDIVKPASAIVAHEWAHALMRCSGLGGTNDDHGQELFEDTIEGIRVMLTNES